MLIGKEILLLGAGIVLGNDKLRAKAVEYAKTNLNDVGKMATDLLDIPTLKKETKEEEREV